jgi:polyisoprenoid-binding protein YceI
MKTLLRLALALLLAALPTLAAATTWQIDPAHAHIEFKVRHLMVAWVKGSFPDIAGSVEFDEATPAQARINVTIGTASIDTNNAKRDEHLRSPDFFDVASFPQMTFTSKKIVAGAGPVSQIVGDLTIRGVTREVTLTIDELTPIINDPWGHQRRGATARTEINRKDFGLTWNKAIEAGGVAVGDEVKITIDIELIKK